MLSRSLRALGGAVWVGFLLSIVSFPVRPVSAETLFVEGASDFYFFFDEPTVLSVRAYAIDDYGIDSHLWLYNESLEGVLVAANDDYYYLDSFLEVELEAGYSYRLRAGVCCGDPDQWRGEMYRIEVSSVPVEPPPTTTSTTTTTVPETTTTSTTTTSTTTTSTTTTSTTTTSTTVPDTTSTTTIPESTTSTSTTTSTTTTWAPDTESTTTTTTTTTTVVEPTVPAPSPTTSSTSTTTTVPIQPPIVIPPTTALPETTLPPPTSTSTPPTTVPETASPTTTRPTTVAPTIPAEPESPETTVGEALVEDKSEPEPEPSTTVPNDQEIDSGPDDETEGPAKGIVEIADLNEDLSRIVSLDLETLSDDDLDSMIDLIETSDLTDDEAEAVSLALSNAPDEVKAQFEEQINVYGGQFDSYVPRGSLIPVGERRTLVAVTAGVALPAAGAARRRNP